MMFDRQGFSGLNYVSNSPKLLSMTECSSQYVQQASLGSSATCEQVAGAIGTRDTQLSELYTKRAKSEELTHLHDWDRLHHG
jgi:hypothetical protein